MDQIRSTMRRARDESGQVDYEFAKFADMMGEQPRMLRDLMDMIPCGLCLIDAKARVFHWNAEAQRLTGITASQAVGKTCQQIWDCPNLDKACPIAHPGGGSPEPVCVDMVLNANGRTVHLQKTTYYFYNSANRLMCAVESLVDLTRQKEAEKALQEGRDLVESARQAKRHFMANMNHEIRTPLNGIVGLLDLMLSENPGPSQMEYISTAKRSAGLLIDLVDDILDFTIVDKGDVHIELTGFSLASIISSVIARQYALIQNNQVCIHSRIEEDVPDNLLGDSGRLYQILKQLVGNAIKFTPAGEIAVTVARTPVARAASGDEARQILLHFSISDTGVGIPGKKMDAIFQSLCQVDESRTRSFGGLGIGLNMVHKLVLVLEGRIWMESESGRGTTVHFILPFKSIASGKTDPDSSPAKTPPADFSSAGATTIGAAPAGTPLVDTYIGPTDRKLCLAATQLSAQWRTRFQALATLIVQDPQGAETLIAELKTQAQASNQSSVATLLFRMLLALRRADKESIDHFYALINCKLRSDPGVCPETPEGGTHESTRRRR